MYRENPRNQQPLLLSDVNHLPARLHKRLLNSWAETFREEVFLRINEDAFSVLYSEKTSRPNIPVNILLGLEIMKGGRNWTDEELYEQFCFDLQVRYAVGCDTFGEDEFELRTLYNFRRRIAEHMLSTGENLMMGLFEHITDEQMAKIGLKTDKQRMDSTMLLSNIADLSRLELLVGTIQRLWRMLGEADQTKYADDFQPYIKESAGHFTYRLKGSEVVWSNITLIGQKLQRLLMDLLACYGEDPIYSVARRFFEENFILENGETRAKDNSEIKAGCLQSLDDLEATYRQKGTRKYKGYVANIAETCHPDNPVQLIDQVQVAPNQVTDMHLLKEGLKPLKERTGMDTVVTDGAYVGAEIDALCREEQVEQISTALTGKLPDHKNGRLTFSEFDMTQDMHGEVIAVTCPAGQPGQIQSTARGRSYRMVFDAAICQKCPLFQINRCPVERNKKLSYFGLYVPKARANSSQRRRHFEKHKFDARNLRPAVEASVFQLKHKWVNGKLRVRGLFRVTNIVVCSALHVNLRRIEHYRKGKLRMKLVNCMI